MENQFLKTGVSNGYWFLSIYTKTNFNETIKDKIMKKKFLFFIFVMFLTLTTLFSQEEISFHLNRPDRDLLKSSQTFSFKQNYNPHFNQNSIINYSNVVTDEQSKVLLKKIELANMVLSIFTLAGYTSNVILGAFVLSEKFLDQPYWNGILYTHIPIGITSGLLAATVISLGYVDIGIKSKYHLIPNKANAISIYINTGLAVAEIGFVVANLITSRLNPEAAKWIGLAHAITTTGLLIGLSVQFGTSFIKNE
jgi:hypothetical protein